jgi:hypothetical protein
VYNAPALCIIVSPSQQESIELFRKVVGFLELLVEAPKSDQETLQRLTLRNGSRIISLPGSEKTVRGYSAAKLVVIDEAARVPDEMLAAIRPMLATTAGKFSPYRRPPASVAGFMTRGSMAAKTGSALKLRLPTARASTRSS